MSPEPEQKPEENPIGETPVAAAKGSNVGYELAGTVIGCLIIGWLLDRYAGTSPWGILGMLVIGVAAGFMNVWRTLNGYDQSVGLHKRNGE